MYTHIYIFIIYIIIYLCSKFNQIFINLVNKSLSLAGISEDNAQSLLGQLFINHTKAFIQAKKYWHLREEVFNNIDKNQERDETFIYGWQGYFA